MSFEGLNKLSIDQKSSEVLEVFIGRSEGNWLTLYGLKVESGDVDSDMAG